MITTVFETQLPGLIHRGKVRDTYDIGDGLMLMVATDRISAFDVVLPTPVPGKGAVLSQMSAFWFDLTRSSVPNHMVGMAYDTKALGNLSEISAVQDLSPALRNRSMVVRRAERIDMECVVRGYITGGGWTEYKAAGTLNGAPLRPGILEAERFDEPLFTPSTKAESGHDVPLSRKEGEDLVRVDLYYRLEEMSLAVYRLAHQWAEARGMILADTKLEFGFIDGELTLIDELLTPDSSRFWDAKDWRPGSSPHAFDKQYVRNWLTQAGWNKEPPAPALPDHVISETGNRYKEAFRRLTGHDQLA